MEFSVALIQAINLSFDWQEAALLLIKW